MRVDLLKLAADLADRGEPFALAIVVRREPASSAQAGDMGLVTEAGAIHGWLGGSCTQPTVVREAQQALQDGRPRLLVLAPDPEPEPRAGVVVQPMTCHSGGTVEVYIEPVLPAPRLVVFGLAPTARALCRLGRAMGYSVEVVDPGADRAAFPEADRVLPQLDPPAPGRPLPRSRAPFAVVATIGQRDEEALLSALAVQPAYLGVVASRRRFAEIREAVAARGASPSALERVKNPAGLDIGARTPEEISLSIIAEIVETRRAAERRPALAVERTAPAEVRDPVCGMAVAPDGGRPRAEHAGHTFYFCCPRCRERFLAAPERYLAGAESEAGR